MNPSKQQWYVAELVVAIAVEGHVETVVHRNLVLLRAENDDAAYDHAIELGKELNDTDVNPAGRAVTKEFLGLGDLAKVHDELEDGAELCFSEKLVADKDALRAALPSRGQLTAFRPRTESPIDYRSRDVVEMMKKMSGGK